MNNSHHLVPNAILKNEDTIDVCQKCHALIHKTFTNEELAQQFNTAEKLKKALRGVELRRKYEREHYENAKKRPDNTA